MNRHPNLRAVALSVVLAASFGLLLQTSLARASSSTADRPRRSANCAAVADMPGCGPRHAIGLSAFPRFGFSPAAPLAPASTIITVTSGGDSGPCTLLVETLRCAINDANGSGTFNTIEFAPTVTRVTPLATLPTITSQGTEIFGALLPSSGIVTIDAAGIVFGNALVINASDVLILDVSIINTASNAADIQILGGRAVRIADNYLGVVPGAANCSFGGHTRNSGVGVDVLTPAGDSSFGSAYFFGNVIGCHANGGAGKGISVEASWTHVGEDLPGSGAYPNYIGVQPGGSPVPNDTGVAFVSGGGVLPAAHNSVVSNTIADNLVNGVELDGSATSGNVISGTVIHGNGRDGICENGDASNNVWTHVSIFHNGGLGINKNGNCVEYFSQVEVVDPPYPVITAAYPGFGIFGRADASPACPVDCVTVELYRVFPNPRGFGEGRTFVGATTTDSHGNWTLVDPNFSGGCYTAFQTTFVFAISNSHAYSSEFGPDNCRAWLPLSQK